MKKEPKGKKKPAKKHSEPARLDDDHVNLRFQAVTLKYEFDNNVTAHWEAKPGEGNSKHDRVSYRVVVEKDPAEERGLSLLTLGIQSVDHAVLIDAVSSDNNLVLIQTEKEVPPKLKNGKWLIPKARTKADFYDNPDGRVPDEESIYLIYFTGASCEIKLTAFDRKKVGYTRWTTTVVAANGDDEYGKQSGHDNMPPGGSTER